jgi:hypothetical protein
MTESPTQAQPAAKAELNPQNAPDELAELANAPKEQKDVPVAPENNAPDERNAAAPHPASLTREPYRPADPEISIDNLPARASLSQRKGMAWMYQRGKWWCIPASIENCFRYVGIWDVKQDQIVRAYVNLYGKGSWFDFNTGARAAATLVDLKARGLQFEVGQSSDRETFYRKVKHAIANNWPVLIAYEIGGGNAHIVSVVAYGEDYFDVFNPATAKIEFMRFSDVKMGSKPGWLILRPIPKQNESRNDERQRVDNGTAKK